MTRITRKLGRLRAPSAVVGRMLLAGVGLLGCSEYSVGDGPGPGPVGDSGAPLVPTEVYDSAEPEPPGPCEGHDVPWALEVAWDVNRLTGALSVGRLADGDGDGDVDADDPLTIVSSQLGAGADKVELLTYGDSRPTTVIDSAFRSPARLGDLDGKPGAELAVAWHLEGTPHRALIYGDALLLDHPLPSNATVTPWLADVDDDGDLDMIVNGGAIDALTGERSLGFPAVPEGARSVALDLDGDLAVEVITAVPLGGNLQFGILSDEGRLVESVCTEVVNGVVTGFESARFAVGNLDEDVDGEFVVATTNRLAVCDTDGSLIRLAEVAFTQPGILGLGDLDGDGSVEIVLTGRYAPEDPTPGGLVVYDGFLREKWSLDLGPWFFTLADLDDDGRLEVLAQGEGGLRILDATGKELTRWEPSSGALSVGQPVVADFDGDGLAEIGVPGEHAAVLENEAGGFPTPGIEAGWSGVDHFPGLMAVDGTLDNTGRHWLEPGSNVWQGHRACVVPEEEGVK